MSFILYIDINKTHGLKKVVAAVAAAAAAAPSTVFDARLLGGGVHRCRQDKTSIMHQIKECQDQLSEKKADPWVLPSVTQGFRA